MLPYIAGAVQAGNRAAVEFLAVKMGIDQHVCAHAKRCIYSMITRLISNTTDDIFPTAKIRCFIGQ